MPWPVDVAGFFKGAVTYDYLAAIQFGLSKRVAAQVESQIGIGSIFCKYLRVVHGLVLLFIESIRPFLRHL